MSPDAWPGMTSLPSPGGASSPERSTSSPGTTTSPEPSIPPDAIPVLLTTPLQADFDPGGAAKMAVRRRRRLTLACPEVSAFPSVLAGLPEVEDQSFADGVAVKQSLWKR